MARCRVGYCCRSAPTAAMRRVLRERGWITVSALEPTADWRAEARRLGCTHVLVDGEPQGLG